MANEYYITAGLPAIDYNDNPPAVANSFYITAGLVANDYTPAGTEYRMIFHNHYQQMKVV